MADAPSLFHHHLTTATNLYQEYKEAETAGLPSKMAELMPKILSALSDANKHLDDKADPNLRAEYESLRDKVDQNKVDQIQSSSSPPASTVSKMDHLSRGPPLGKLLSSFDRNEVEQENVPPRGPRGPAPKEESEVTSKPNLGFLKKDKGNVEKPETSAEFAGRCTALSSRITGRVTGDKSKSTLLNEAASLISQSSEQITSIIKNEIGDLSIGESIKKLTDSNKLKKEIGLLQDEIDEKSNESPGLYQKAALNSLIDKMKTVTKTRMATLDPIEKGLKEKLNNLIKKGDLDSLQKANKFLDDIQGKYQKIYSAFLEVSTLKVTAKFYDIKKPETSVISAEKAKAARAKAKEFFGNNDQFKLEGKLNRLLKTRIDELDAKKLLKKEFKEKMQPIIAANVRDLAPGWEKEAKNSFVVWKNSIASSDAIQLDMFHQLSIEVEAQIEAETGEKLIEADVIFSHLHEQLFPHNKDDTVVKDANENTLNAILNSFGI